MGKKVQFNDSQIEELKLLMSNATMSQKDIAKHFNITDDTLRRIQKENGLTSFNKYKHICALCGDVFYSNLPHSKYCPKVHTRICKVCGRVFTVNKDNIVEGCSKRCNSILKYGTEHPFQSDIVQAKSKAILLAKYGVEHYSQSPEWREKVKQTCIDRYGVPNVMQNADIQAKAAACLSGTMGDLACRSTREAIAKINIEKYGTAYPMQNDIVKAKMKATMVERYGADNIMKTNEGVQALTEAIISKYGAKHAMQIPQVKDKLHQTVKGKYGVDWACELPQCRSAITCRFKLNEKFGEMLSSQEIKYDTEFPLENFVYDFKVGSTLIEIDPTITHSCSMSIFPNSSPKSANYHLDKTRLAAKYEYRCIHVFDWDNWNDVLDLIKQPDRVIYARNCSITELSTEAASKFINDNHLQGQCRGTQIAVGLIYSDELVQVMTFGKPRYNHNYEWELLRLCTKRSVKVVGGASKLFKYCLRTYRLDNIISYCNISKFTGRVYEAIGMHLVITSSPAKVWSKGAAYLTDNLLRQRGADQLISTNEGKGASNESIMLTNGWLPIYDCGQNVYEYNQSL